MAWIDGQQKFGPVDHPPTPSAAMAANQSSMTGPNTLPIRAVPNVWPANSATRITTAAGST